MASPLEPGLFQQEPGFRFRRNAELELSAFGRTYHGEPASD
jgi:hypothetical protein